MPEDHIDNGEKSKTEILKLEERLQKRARVAKGVFYLILIFTTYTMSISVSYYFGTQKVERIPEKLSVQPTPPTTPPITLPGPGSPSKVSDSETKLAMLEVKTTNLEKTIERLEHSVEMAGSYSTNASNTASFTITAVGIFVIVITLMAGYGAQKIYEEQFKAALTGYQAELRKTEVELNAKVSEALGKLNITKDTLEEEFKTLRQNVKDFETREREAEVKFEARFKEEEKEIQREFKKLSDLKTEVEGLSKYQKENFKPAKQIERKIQEEIQRSYERPSKIKQDIITLLLKDPDLNIELRALFVDHLRQISGLQDVPPPERDIL